MAKYKVKTLAMTVKNNRIAKNGEFVDDSELTTNPSLLIEEGYIEEVESDDAKEVVEETEVEEVEETETETETDENPQATKEKVKAKLAPKK